MFPTTDLNIQFGCCFAVFLIWFFCLIPVRHAQSKAQGGLNNANPRHQYTELAGYGMRASYAHTNTMEGFVFFGFAILANVYGLGNQTAASILSIIYTVSRAIYVPLYIFNYPTARSGIWMISLLALTSLFILPFATPWYSV